MPHAVIRYDVAVKQCPAILAILRLATDRWYCLRPKICPLAHPNNRDDAGFPQSRDDGTSSNVHSRMEKWLAHIDIEVIMILIPDQQQKRHRYIYIQLWAEQRATVDVGS